MGAPQTGDKMAPAARDTLADDSDWEYEYDENDTEDFYFTLDLPRSNEPASKRRKTATEKARENEAASQSQYIMKGQTRRQSAAQQHPTSRQQPSEDPLRFRDLHTTTPVIEYQDQRYDCQWTTDLGTQFHIARPGTVKKPYKAGRAVDVVSLSRVRLTGRHTRVPAPEEVTDSSGISAGRAIVLDDDEDVDEGASRSGPPGVGSEPQKSFLERLAAIQRKKAARPGNGVNGIPAGMGLAAITNTQPHQNTGGVHVANGATESGQLPDVSSENATPSTGAANGPSNIPQSSLPTPGQILPSAQAQQGQDGSDAGGERDHATEEPV